MSNAPFSVKKRVKKLNVKLLKKKFHEDQPRRNGFYWNTLAGKQKL